MSLKDGVCMYDKSHTIQIYDKNGEMHERNLNITVINTNDILQIKLRDPLEYCFNYTENIDVGDFEVMRLNQNLDINFNELKYNLIEMLQQFQKREMFLKCQLSNQKCTLIFYFKSKIKSIVYLTIDLHTTNQKEIFSELTNNMQYIQESNERLKKQLTNIRKCVSEKDQEIHKLILLRNEREGYFHNSLKQLNNLFNARILEIQTLLVNKMKLTQQRVVKLLNDVDTLKKETILKSESSRNLVKTMGELRIETNNNLAMINHLKKENSTLHTTKINQDRHICDLQKHLQDKDSTIAELQKKNNEMKNDMEKLTVLMAQKKATIEELSKDLLQANQMLVNFNNHYDNKSKQVEELQSALMTKDAVIKEQKLKTNELLKEFENYKVTFNYEIQENLKHELCQASNKIADLEITLRKANKINALLTEKVNNNPFFGAR